jgi:hypothetical protein
MRRPRDGATAFAAHGPRPIPARDASLNTGINHGYRGHLREQAIDDGEQLRWSQTEFNASGRFVDDAIRRAECRGSRGLQRCAGASSSCCGHQNRSIDHQR